MEFLKIVRRRSVLSEIIYTVLNVALAIAVLIAVRVTDSPVAALSLVFLSKWRVLAVRPRYWFVNVQANLVDLIVSVSLVVLLYAADGALLVQIILTALYIGWLLFVKPRSKRAWVTVQAGVALFVGIVALYTVSYAWPSSVVTVLMWLIGYSTARHVLGAYDEAHLLFLSLVWGLFMAELGWLAYHWTIAYSIPGIESIKIPQIAIIAAGIGFLAERIYASQAKHESVRPAEIMLPALLTLSVIMVLVVFFNDISSVRL